MLYKATRFSDASCVASLAGDQGDLGAGRGCGYIYRQFHCYPSASLIDKEIN